jgi:hypothetical protein
MEHQAKKPTPHMTASRRTAADGRPRARRGRPPKFGQPSHLVALTLPKEVLAALRTIHQDPGWAIVQLVDPILNDRTHRLRPKSPAALAELVHLPGRRALIVVQPQVFTRLRGVSTIPLADGRAFLAFDGPGGLAELEVAILDQLEAAPPRSAQRAQLAQARGIVRSWRRNPRLVFRTKSILVVEGGAYARQRPLTALETATRPSGAGAAR